MLGLVPPGADAEVELTDTDVVNGHCPFRQDRRMAIDHTGYQRDDPRPLGNSCHAASVVQPSNVGSASSAGPQKWS